MTPGTAVSVRDAEDRKAAAKAALEDFCTGEHVAMWVLTRRYLHKFSLTNQLLILLQLDEGERTDGVQASWRWKKAGYHPAKGAKAIYVWAPMRKKKDADGSWLCEVCRARATGPRCPQGHPRAARFVLKPVFSASSVVSFEDGSPPPSPPSPAPLTGNSHEAVLDRLLDSAFIAEAQVSKVRFAGPEDDESIGRGAHGYFRPNDRSITIARDANNAMLATLIHELCHALIERGTYERAQEELVVESAAMLACAALGLDTTAQAAPYIAGWGGKDGQSPHEQVKSHMTVIDSLARRIEQACEPPTEEEPGA